MKYILSRRPTAIVGLGQESIGGEARPEGVIRGSTLLEAGDEFGFSEGGMSGVGHGGHSVNLSQPALQPQNE